MTATETALGTAGFPIAGIMIGIMMASFGILFAGEGELSNPFEDVERPTGLLSFAEFVLDGTIALGKLLFMAMGGDFGFPVWIQIPYIIIVDGSILWAFVILVIAVVEAVVP